MDPIDLVALGQEIATTGTRLRELKEQRAVLDGEINQLEDKLRPLMTQYSGALVAIVGPLPQPALAPTPPSLFAQVPVPSSPEHIQTTVAPNVQSVVANDGVKQRILGYLKRAKVDEGMSALEIAEALHVDPTMVRQVLVELQQRERDPSA